MYNTRFCEIWKMKSVSSLKTRGEVIKNFEIQAVLLHYNSVKAYENYTFSQKIFIINRILRKVTTRKFFREKEL